MPTEAGGAIIARRDPLPALRHAPEDGWLARLVFAGLLAVLAWAPLPFASNRPWSWSLLSLLVGALLVLWAIALARRPWLLRLSWRRCAAPGILFLAALAWASLQTAGFMPEVWHDPLWAETARALGRPLRGAISTDPAASIGGVMRLMTYAGVFWLAAQYGRNPAFARAIVWGVTLCGVAYAIYGLAAFAAGNQMILWYRRWAYAGDLSSTFVARASYGAFAGLGLLCGLALLFRTVARSAAGDDGRRSVLRLLEALPPSFYLLVVACMTLATALVLTHSRGAVAVTALGVVVLLTALFLRQRHARAHVLVGALLVIAAGLAVLDISGRVTLGRMVQLARQGTGREAIHALTERAIAAAPLTGQGLDTFANRYFQFRGLSIPWDSPRYDKAHSTYLELAMELGLPAFAILMTAVAVVIGTIAAGIARRRRDALYPMLGLAATALVGSHALLDFSIQIPAVAVTYAALLGVAFAQSWPTRG